MMDFQTIARRDSVRGRSGYYCDLLKNSLLLCFAELAPVAVEEQAVVMSQH